MKARSGSSDQRQRGQAETLQQAAFALQSGRPLDAERMAGEFLKTNASHPDAAMLLGCALLMQERFAEAVLPLETAARANPNPQVETQLAIALRRAGDSDAALVWLQRAIKRTPPFPPAFHELSSLLNALARPGEAVEVLKQGIAVAPTTPELWSQLGVICSGMNDRTGAAEAYSRALVINPLHPGAVKGMTSLLMREGDYAGAATLFKRVVAAYPEEASARMGLGICLLELGDEDAAFDSLRASIAKGVRFETVLKAILSSARGRFWLNPSRAAAFLKSGSAF